MIRWTALTLLGLFGAAAQMRPPAVPLVAHDPYFSIWSMADHLNGDGTKHWTGKPNTLTAYARIDGKSYRIMGRERQAGNELAQTRLEVLPTRTIYEFAGAGAKVGLTFFTPALPDDLDVLSRPLTYLEWSAASSDGREHAVEIYFDAGSDLVVNTPDQPVLAARYQLDGFPLLRMGSREQGVLAKRGDDLRIDWGYLYLASDKAEGVSTFAGDRAQARAAFDASGKLPDTDELGDVRRGGPVLAYAIALGKVNASPVSRYLMLAYDDLYAIEYFERKERAWWRRNGATAADLVRNARREHGALLERAQRFDTELMADLRKAGGDKYAQLAVLAYRQTLAAHKLVADVDGTALYFPKENFSNGCIATVDVIYPSAPFALLFSPRLMKAQLQPVMDYARMDRWRFPFAPHDLGTYPQANGQVYGGGERTEENQMPVEESGNMLIMLAALARVEGNADYTARYWPQVTKWAEYLSAKGLDPGEPALDRRFRGTPGAQCESLDQGDPGAGRVCAAGWNDGAPAGCGALPQDRGGVCRQVERTGGRGRPLQAGLRQVRHLEPEVQPGVGSTAGPETVPGGDRAQGDCVLSHEAKSVRVTAGQSERLHQARLGGVDCHDGREPRRFREDCGAGVAVRQRFRQPRAAHRLVRHEDGEAAGLSGAVGSGRTVY